MLGNKCRQFHDLPAKQSTDTLSESYLLQIKSIKTQIKILRKEYKEKIAPQILESDQAEAKAISNATNNVVIEAKNQIGNDRLQQRIKLHQSNHVTRNKSSYPQALFNSSRGRAHNLSPGHSIAQPPVAIVPMQFRTTSSRTQYSPRRSSITLYQPEIHSQTDESLSSDHRVVSRGTDNIDPSDSSATGHVVQSPSPPSERIATDLDPRGRWVFDNDEANSPCNRRARGTRILNDSNETEYYEDEHGNRIDIDGDSDSQRRDNNNR